MQRLACCGGGRRTLRVVLRGRTISGVRFRLAAPPRRIVSRLLGLPGARRRAFGRIRYGFQRKTERAARPPREHRSQRRRENPIGCRPRRSGNTRREEERRRPTGGEKRWAWDTPSAPNAAAARTLRLFHPAHFGRTPSASTTAGNAAEWVEDCWNPTCRGAPSDGSAWTNGECSLPLLRVGSFADKALAVRSSARFRYDEDVRYYANGFRVAHDLN
jgi:Sulfatase-modifying factor enzyme 1